MAGFLRPAAWASSPKGPRPSQGPTPDPAPAADPAWAWLAAAHEGHESAARQLVDALGPTALALARHMLHHPADAQDAVQEAFERLWAASPQGDRGATLATYFHTIVLNRCRTRLRQQREWATDPDELTPLVDAHATAAPANTPHLAGADGFSDADPRLQQRLHRALQQLPPRQRLALSLWAYADADAAAIAHRLEVPVNAAHQLLHRARQSLQRLFHAHMP